VLSKRQRGDTLIEVLFSVTVFSFVVVGALTIMNQGTAASQRALEITLVRQQIDGQAETLRFMHNAYVAAYQPGITFNTADAVTSPAEEWFRMLNSGITAQSASAFGTTSTACPTPPDESFVIDTRNVRFVNGSGTSLRPSVTFAQVSYASDGAFQQSQGLWVEAIRSPVSSGVQSNAGFIDFHIRGCWEAPGLTAPLTTGTIVRLYEPRG
jgi:type II secretory pathway pseudopilin PulG